MGALRWSVLNALMALALSLVATGRGFAADAAPTANGSIAKPSAEASAAKPPGATSAVPADEAPTAGPFGPGYDPTRPPPEEPRDKGKGIVSATVVAVGPADVEELRMTGHAGVPAYFGVALEIRIEAGSTTPMLDAASVTAQPDSGSAMPLLAACLPTMDDPLALYHRLGVRVGAWNVAIDGRTWYCGGRTGRLAIRVATGGFRVTIKPGADWNGPLILLFAAQPGSPRRVVLPGATVELPLPSRGSDKSADQAGDRAN